MLRLVSLCALLLPLGACAMGSDLPPRSDGAAGRDAGPSIGTDAGAGDIDAGAGGETDGGETDAGPGGTVACMATSECAASEVCDFTAVGCGAGLGRCIARPTNCTTGQGVVCGCDGELYGSECEANMAGAGVDPGNACLDCTPVDDFTITGSCPVPYGFRWTGTDCVAVPQGCECTGPDCERILNFTRCMALAVACGG